MPMRTSCKQSGPTPVIQTESPEEALHREKVELVKLAKELGSKQLVSEYEKEVKHLQEVLEHFPTTLAAQNYKQLEKLAKGLVQELRGRVESTESMWQQMALRENCNKVINAARRWLLDEVLYS
jgi:exonuclease VII large subunit